MLGYRRDRLAWAPRTLPKETGAKVEVGGFLGELGVRAGWLDREADRRPPDSRV